MNKYIKNVSLNDKIVANINYIKNLIELSLNCSKVYRNYFHITISILKRKYPIQTILKNGNCVLLTNFNAAFFIASLQNHKGLEYYIEKDVVNILSMPELVDNKKIKLHGGINNGDIVNVFLKNSYRVLPVKGKTVIDVGSNIGDSLIYFALRDAEKIIGVEPFPRNYELAKKNIEVNNFSDKIIILLAGCSATSGYITVDPEYESGIDSKLDEFRDGIKVPLLTLKQILNDFNVPNDSILKMDCEGCEYETILTTPEEIFERFSHIMIEYHHGYKNLKEKLEKCGFIVSVTKPSASGFISSYFYVLKQFFLLKNLRKPQEHMSDQKTTDKFHKMRQKYHIEYVGLIHAIRNK